MSRIALLIALLLSFGAAACGSDESGDPEGAAGGPATTETEASTSADASGGCPEVPQPAGKPDGGEKKPEAELDPAKTYEVVVETSCGEFTITLDVESAPATAASFVSLAKKGFYDDTYFHRIVPGFVIQGGDPTGTGSGGPGYSTKDEPSSDATYRKGVVAMAKAGNEPPGTAGSQFFVVTGPDAGLPPEYAIIGKVTGGLDVVEKIGALGDPTERPLQVITIEGMEVKES